MDNFKRNKIVVALFIIFLSISPAFALGEGNRNLLLISVMCISPIFLLKYPIIIPRVDAPLIGLCTMMIFFPLVLHPETMRWSTVLYSCMFCLYFMSFARVLYHSSFTGEDFFKVLRGLLFAYCIVLIIQQFCVLTGLPIFNVSNYTPLEPWKLNSLMSEPSHSARIIPIMMYMYITLKMKMDMSYTFKQSIKEDRWVWLAFLWPVLTMGSATAFIFMLIVFVKFIDIKKFIPSILLVFSLVVIFSILSENKSVTRVRNVLVATVTLNEEAIIRADHSASFRIVPTIQGAKKAGFGTVNDWLGYGVDADQELIAPLPSVQKGSAGAFYMWINFGLIVAILFWAFSFRIIFMKEDKIPSILIWILVPFMAGGINSQIIWLVLCLFFTYKYIIHKNDDFCAKIGISPLYMQEKNS